MAFKLKDVIKSFTKKPDGEIRSAIYGAYINYCLLNKCHAKEDELFELIKAYERNAEIQNLKRIKGALDEEGIEIEFEEYIIDIFKIKDNISMTIRKKKKSSFPF